MRLVSQDDFGVWLVLEGFVTLVFCLCIPGISLSIGIPEEKEVFLLGRKCLIQTPVVGGRQGASVRAY